MTELRFDDRVAVITGGGRGLGAAHARLLAARGCKVVINDPGVSMAGDATSEGPAEALAAEIRASGGEAVANTDSVPPPKAARPLSDARSMPLAGSISSSIPPAMSARPRWQK